jgi:hypothetical protein
VSTTLCALEWTLEESNLGRGLVRAESCHWTKRPSGRGRTRISDRLVISKVLYH